MPSVSFRVKALTHRWNNQNSIGLKDLLLALETFRGDLLKEDMKAHAQTAEVIINVLRIVNDRPARDVQANYFEMVNLLRRWAG